MIMICFDFVHTAVGCATQRANPLNTQYNSKLMHHSYAQSDWLENWTKFVYYFFFFFAFVLITMSCVSELPLACMRYLAMPILAVIESSFLVHPKKSTKRKMLCVRCRCRCHCRHRCRRRRRRRHRGRLGRCHKTQNDHHQMERIRSHGPSLSSFSFFFHLPRNSEVEIGCGVWLCCAERCLDLWAREKHLLNMVMARKIYSNAILCQKFG